MQNPPTTEEMLAVINDYARACIAGSQTRTPATRRLAEEKATALLNQIQEAVDLLQQPAQAPRDQAAVGTVAALLLAYFDFDANPDCLVSVAQLHSAVGQPGGHRLIKAALDRLVAVGCLQRFCFGPGGIKYGKPVHQAATQEG